MKWHKWSILLFVLVTILHVALPVSWIWQSESSLQKGQAYKFKLRPTDPSDPFRGKYLILRFEAEEFSTYDSVTWEKALPWKEGFPTVYASLEADTNGFAIVTEVSITAPESGDYIKAEYYYYNRHVGMLGLTFPFNRYYIEESLAKQAEQMMWELDNAENTIAYAQVYVYEGEATLEGLYVNDQQIEEVVKYHRELELLPTQD